jgi:hypothetical protein
MAGFIVEKSGSREMSPLRVGEYGNLFLKILVVFDETVNSKKVK